MAKISYEVVERDTLWVAKMTWGRQVGTYAEVGYLSSDEECRDFDILAEQPEHLKEFYDEYFAYEREHGFTIISDFYNKVYNPANS